MRPRSGARLSVLKNRDDLSWHPGSRPSGSLRASDRIPDGVDCLFINPPLVYRTDMDIGTLGLPKDSLVRCINPGILSLAGWLVRNDHTVQIIDLIDTDGSLGGVAEQVRAADPKVVGISCMTGFAYKHVRELVAIARDSAPSACIVLGGQHVGPQARTVLEDTRSADAVVMYEGEWVLEEMVRRVKNGDDLIGIPGTALQLEGGISVNAKYPPQIALDDLPMPPYELYPAYQSFVPFVEESRGCFARCEYCITPFTNEYRIRRKSVERILAEIDYTLDAWGASATTYPLAMLASTFGVKVSEALELIDGIGRRGVQWTTELRGDSKLTAHLDRIAASGAEGLYFGMESASPTQLRRMDKTRKAEDYLGQIREILARAQSLSTMLMKIGLMFYVGEDETTLKETWDFLDGCGTDVKWVSMSPLFVFGGTPLFDKFDEYTAAFGSSLHKDGLWAEMRAYPVNPSSTISFQDSVDFARRLESRFRTRAAHARVFKAEDDDTRVW
jgi:radical SAM superfamily enzyme YgiQ (UPF0313 family)